MSDQRIIGITGPARCGKDTVAAMTGCKVMHFAGPLKEMLRAGFGLSEAQLYGDQKETIDPRYGVTPRHMMQTLGTEWARELIAPDIWVKVMAARLHSNVVIPDVRFENEATMIRSRGGVIWHITGRGGIDGGHKSEDGVEIMPNDKIIDNSGDINNLTEIIKSLI